MKYVPVLYMTTPIPVNFVPIGENLLVVVEVLDYYDTPKTALSYF